MRWVAQEDPDGCGVAVLATLTGQTFAEVDQAFPYRLRGETDKDRCLEPHHIEGYLWDRGYFLRRIIDRKHSGGRWPPQPFAPAHFLMVKSPTHNAGHWIVMDSDGGVFDPWDESRKTLDVYSVFYMSWGVLLPPGGGLTSPNVGR